MGRSQQKAGGEWDRSTEGGVGFLQRSGEAPALLVQKERGGCADISVLMDLGWEGKGYLFDSLNFTSERVTFEDEGRGCGVVWRGLWGSQRIRFRKWAETKEAAQSEPQVPLRGLSCGWVLVSAAGDGHTVSLEAGLWTRYIPAGVVAFPAARWGCHVCSF